MQSIPLLLLLLSLSGCLGRHARLRCPHRDRVTWRQLRSERFELNTNASRAKARRTLRWLERSYELLQERFAWLAPATGPLPTPIEVLLVKTDHDYRAVGGSSRTSGMSLSGTEGGEIRRVLVLPYVFPDWLHRENILHELAHLFVFHHVPAAPHWLKEGLCHYYETLSEEQRGTVAGRPVRYLRRGSSFTGINPRHLPTVSRIRAWPWRVRSRTDIIRWRASTWGLVHLLFTPPWRAHFRHYLSRLKGDDPPRRVWTQIFGHKEGPLDRALRLHLAPRNLPTRVVLSPLGSSGRAVSERSLSDDDFHLALVRLRPRLRSMIKQTLRDLNRVIRSRPRNPEVVYWASVLGKGSRKGREYRIQSALRTRATDPRLWHELLRVRLELLERHRASDAMADRVRAARNHLARVARTGGQFATVARAYLIEGAPRRALRFALRAVEVEPSCWTCWRTLARARIATGDPGEAVRCQRRAKNLAPRHRRSELAATLRRYQRTRQRRR